MYESRQKAGGKSHNGHEVIACRLGQLSRAGLHRIRVMPMNPSSCGTATAAKVQRRAELSVPPAAGVAVDEISAELHRISSTVHTDVSGRNDTQLHVE